MKTKLDYEPCLHVDVFPIKKWWGNGFVCKRCDRTFAVLPKNDYFETNIILK